MQMLKALQLLIPGFTSVGGHVVSFGSSYGDLLIRKEKKERTKDRKNECKRSLVELNVLVLL